MRRLHSRQRSGVVSQQRLRPRRFDSTVKRVPKLRFEPVSFLFLVCFWIEVTTSRWAIWFVLCRWRPIDLDDLHLSMKRTWFFEKQVSLHELTSWKHETLKQVSICNEYEKIPGWWTFFSFPNGFSNLSNSRFRSLIGWIQAIKLRKREFDRLEKTRRFY